MTRKTISLTILLLSALWLSAACGMLQRGNTNSANTSYGANTNSGKASTQTNTTPVTIGIDALMSEFQTDPLATYEKYKERMMTVTGKLKSVKIVDSSGESPTWSVELQTATGSDESYKGRFTCLNRVSFTTGNLYSSLESKLEGLKQAGQLTTAPTVTVNGLYRNRDEILLGSPPEYIELAPCDMVGAN